MTLWIELCKKLLGIFATFGALGVGVLNYVPTKGSVESIECRIDVLERRAEGERMAKEAEDKRKLCYSAQADFKRRTGEQWEPSRAIVSSGSEEVSRRCLDSESAYRTFWSRVAAATLVVFIEHE